MHTTVFYTNHEQAYEYVTDDWKEVVKSLGLKGQQMSAERIREGVSPFLEARGGLLNALYALYPDKKPVEDFSDFPLPSEIVVALHKASKTMPFEEILVLTDYDASTKTEGGAVIASKGYYYQTRWGTGNLHGIDDMKFESRKAAEEYGVRPENVMFYAEKVYLVALWDGKLPKFATLEGVIAGVKEKAYAKHMLNKKTELQERIKEAERDLADLPYNAAKMFDMVPPIPKA